MQVQGRVAVARPRGGIGMGDAPASAGTGLQVADPALQARRRARIKALMGKAPVAPVQGKRGPGGAAAKPRVLEDIVRKQAMHRAYRVLVDTPVDADGLVPGTAFSVAGLRKLVSMLRTRAANQELAGSKVAQGLLNFMAPSGPDDSQVEWMSVAKLQRLAGLAQRDGTS
jgi:hypothetical protein